MAKLKLQGFERNIFLSKFVVFFYFFVYSPLRSDRQRHQCETERDLDVSGLEVSHSLSEHPHTLTRSSVHSQNADDSDDADDGISTMMRCVFVCLVVINNDNFLEFPPSAPLGHPWDTLGHPCQ